MKRSENNSKHPLAIADQRMLDKAVAVLDDSLEASSPTVMKRLDAARHAAMLRAWQPMHSEEGITQTLDQSAQQLPADINERLDAIRQQAIARGRSAKNDTSASWLGGLWPPKGYAIPGSAFAFSCLLVTAITLFPAQSPQEEMPLVVAENDLVLVPDQELELYENLEFYQWLADAGLPN